MLTTTRSGESSVRPAVLFMAFELGSTQWKVAFAVGLGTRPRMVQVPARDVPRVWKEVARAKTRFGLSAEAPVRSCYEAGRDGFWLHRALLAHGVTNVVVDPSSIAVDRRARRAKTDRLDAIALVTQLILADAGDRRGWREVRVPSVEAEAARQLHRERETVRQALRAVDNRIQGLLLLYGVTGRARRLTPAAVRALRDWAGAPLPEAVQARVAREAAAGQALATRLRLVDRDLHARVKGDTDVVAQQARTLTRLRGVGELGAVTLSTELFAWRAFTNGRQVGAIVGLTPTPYCSDQSQREQGISRSGNRRVRTLLVEMAWAWVRWQPVSALTQWYQARFAQHGRARKIGIIALARKLLIALWRWVDQGVVPAGAIVRG
jgi:transposase